MNKLFTLLELIGFVLLVIAGMYYLLPAKELPTFLPGFDPKNTMTNGKEALTAAGIGIALFIISFISSKFLE